MSWVDIVILAIVLIFIIIGCVKGFVFSILSIFSSTVNLFIALFLTTPVSRLLNSIFNLETSLSNHFANNLSSMKGFDIELSSFGSQAELSSHVSETINNSSLSGFIKGLLNNTVHITTDNVQGTNVTLNNIISSSFATFLTLVISFVIIFALIYLILWIVSKISKKAHQIADIKLTDRILGIVFGFIKGFIVVVFIFAVLSLFNENGVLIDLFTEIKKSTIGGWLYEQVSTFMHKYVDFREIAKNIIDKI